MNRVVEFRPQLASTLPATYALLMSANLTVHPAVTRIILHGSRGLAGGYRFSSDIDLSLIVDTSAWSIHSNQELLFQAVVETTLHHWRAIIEPDLAVVFDVRSCTLKCFHWNVWNEQLCTQGGVDCFGLYKTQKGFSGTVTNAGVQVKLMYPYLKIWQRA